MGCGDGGEGRAKVDFVALGLDGEFVSGALDVAFKGKRVFEIDGEGEVGFCEKLYGVGHVVLVYWVCTAD